jgi:N-acetylmuramoyl-L-alanine amidase
MFLFMPALKIVVPSISNWIRKWFRCFRPRCFGAGCFSQRRFAQRTIVGLALLLIRARAAFAAALPVIVLDPGHSGTNLQSVDEATGLIDHDYPNHPEMEEMFRVARKVGAMLSAHGYQVVYTKKSVTDSVSLRQRATIAQDARASLAVSIHDDHSQPFSTFAQVYAQRVGAWRGGTELKPKAVFQDLATAKTSQAFGQIFVRERTRAEAHPVTLTAVSFAGRAGLEPGNIPEVQLFVGLDDRPIPWVYNEVGGIGFGARQEKQYAQGLVNAIEKCVPVP